MRRRIVIMMAAVLATVVVSAGAGPGAAGQRGPRPRDGYAADPDYWVGLSIGYVDGTTVDDGDTGSQWRFGYTAQIRATLEKTIQRGITVGAAAGFASPPLTYVSGSFDPRTNCLGSCEANADVTQLMAFVHGGAGVGFHFVYNLEGGATEFSNFRVRSTDASLPPSNKYDFTFGFGGGLGFGFSPISDIYVDEMTDLVLHPSNGASTTAPRLFTFRAGFRVGF
ncbi:MAG TPA: hypothetical protein VFR41_14975 [Acidimicrobiia bacterium]|nr:hypothetical protein [Acidimicrobiia bacterium]